MKIIHNITLDVSKQGVQATIPVTQNDAHAHRVVVLLRNGSETVPLTEEDSAALYLPEGDVLDPVTIYTAKGAYPNRLVYDVSAAACRSSGMARGVFTIVNGEGMVLYSPEIALSVRADLTGFSQVTSSAPYAAVVQARTIAEGAAASAIEAAARAEEAAETVSANAEQIRAKVETMVQETMGEVLGEESLETNAQSLRGAINEVHSMATRAEQNTVPGLSRRLQNLEAAAEGQLYVSYALAGPEIDNPYMEDRVLPYGLVSKLYPKAGKLPQTVGGLSIPADFATEVSHLLEEASYLDLTEGKVWVEKTETVQSTLMGDSLISIDYYDDGTSFWCYLPDDMTGIPSESILFPDMEAQGWTVSREDSLESERMVTFYRSDLTFSNEEEARSELEACLSEHGTFLYTVTKTNAYELSVSFDPYLDLAQEDTVIASDNGGAFELVYMERTTA